MEIKQRKPYHLLKFSILVVLFNLIPLVQTYGQSTTRVLTGVVTDKVSNESLPGAIVSAEISGKSTSTDSQGRFSLEVSPNDKVTIKMMGYVYQTISITDQRSLNVVLDFASSDLAEVVVVGYGTQKKVNLTGSVASVSAEDLQGRPVTALSTALQI
ncbi:MAG: carboxypeptidase-like regulatory domain-containing protein [Daejeonella sp.]|uniref:carboxypeptidase-like regulatory domain-containing protein n=1 Tax=Daejeonella sp. TaxID=2805397 RepID=UPI003C73FFF2